VRGESPSADITAGDLKTVLGPAEFESEVAAAKPVPGVVTGLAFTPAGGEILFVEATKMPGRGQLNLTGQLGEVMRESAHAASSIIRSRTGRWRIKPASFRSVDLHVHVPGGAIPKDGPSAGVAMLTAMTSVLLGRVVDPAIGMTGEITLSGRILPVGGIREKVLAAHRAGLKTILLPARNEPNLEEIPADVREQITFRFVNTIDEVLDFVFDARGAKLRGKRRGAGSKTATKRRSLGTPAVSTRSHARKKAAST
jgi:ATP-dependent Lon protease